MKHTRRDRQWRAGEPCTSKSYGVEFATTARKNCYFTALSSIHRMAAGDHETVLTVKFMQQSKTKINKKCFCGINIHF